MEVGEERDPRLISRVRDRIELRGVADERLLLPAAGQGRKADPLWRAKMAFLVSRDMRGSVGEIDWERAQTHSGQMGPPAKKPEW